MKFLLANGADAYAKDCNSLIAFDVAVSIQSVSLIKILTADIVPCMFSRSSSQKTTLPWSFLLPAESSNQELQGVIINALVRHQDRLPNIRPFHDLTTISDTDASLFAERLYAAGFQDLEQYDERGRTPLISACSRGAAKMTSFLLRYGAKPSTEHRDAGLRPAHFMFHNSICYRFGDSYDWISRISIHRRENIRLLEAGFKVSHRVASRCRCSPDGYTPLTAMYRNEDMSCSYCRKQKLDMILGVLNSQYMDANKLWRSLVIVEVFERLEMTHTCIHQHPIVRVFPEEDRLEIEEEEEELYFELNRIMDDYDQSLRDFSGTTARYVEIFFDKLDCDLRPIQGPCYGDCPDPPKTWSREDSDIFRPRSSLEESMYLSTNGRWVLYGHEEGEGESNLLGCLFD